MISILNPVILGLLQYLLPTSQPITSNLWIFQKFMVSTIKKVIKSFFKSSFSRSCYRLCINIKNGCFFIGYREFIAIVFQLVFSNFIIFNKSYLFNKMTHHIFNLIFSRSRSSLNAFVRICMSSSSWTAPAKPLESDARAIRQSSRNARYSGWNSG